MEQFQKEDIYFSVTKNTRKVLHTLNGGTEYETHDKVKKTKTNAKDAKTTTMTSILNRKKTTTKNNKNNR